MTARERVARVWHEGSDHAADGTPFGGPLCNCWRVAGRIMPMLAEAWDEGYPVGNRHNGRRDENPYRQEDQVELRVEYFRTEYREKMLAAYPTIAGLTAYRRYYADGEERDRAFARILAAKHLRRTHEMYLEEGRHVDQ